MEVEDVKRAMKHLNGFELADKNMEVGHVTEQHANNSLEHEQDDGRVHIYVDKLSPQGNVYVKSPNIGTAVATVNDLHGRWKMDCRWEFLTWLQYCFLVGLNDQAIKAWFTSTRDLDIVNRGMKLVNREFLRKVPEPPQPLPYCGFYVI